jgi:hypothetical protein
MKQKMYFVRLLLVTFALLMSFVAAANYAEAKTANEINASVNAAMNRFYKQVDGAKEFMDQAKGYDPGTCHPHLVFIHPYSIHILPWNNNPLA